MCVLDSVGKVDLLSQGVCADNIVDISHGSHVDLQVQKFEFRVFSGSCL